MNISLSALKKLPLYKGDCQRPWAKVCGALLSPQNAQVEALCVKTLSLVPICYAVRIPRIEYVSKSGIFVDDVGFICLKTSGTESVAVRLESGGNRRIRDLYFDTQTGEISHIIVSESRFTKKHKIPVNNIYVKDNTIYTDNKGGIKND